MSTQSRNPPGTGVNFIKKTVAFEILIPEGFKINDIRCVSTYPDIAELSTTVNVLTENISINVRANVQLAKERGLSEDPK